MDILNVPKGSKLALKTGDEYALLEIDESAELMTTTTLKAIMIRESRIREDRDTCRGALGQ